jgi:hypothetical protein
VKEKECRVNKRKNSRNTSTKTKSGCPNLLWLNKSETQEGIEFPPNKIITL